MLPALLERQQHLGRVLRSTRQQRQVGNPAKNQARVCERIGTGASRVDEAVREAVHRQVAEGLVELGLEPVGFRPVLVRDDVQERRGAFPVRILERELAGRERRTLLLVERRDVENQALADQLPVSELESPGARHVDVTSPDLVGVGVHEVEVRVLEEPDRLRRRACLAAREATRREERRGLHETAVAETERRSRRDREAGSQSWAELGLRRAFNEVRFTRRRRIERVRTASVQRHVSARLRVVTREALLQAVGHVEHEARHTRVLRARIQVVPPDSTLEHQVADVETILQEGSDSLRGACLWQRDPGIQRDVVGQHVDVDVLTTELQPVEAAELPVEGSPELQAILVDLLQATVPVPVDGIARAHPVRVGAQVVRQAGQRLRGPEVIPLRVGAHAVVRHAVRAVRVQELLVEVERVDAGDLEVVGNQELGVRECEPEERIPVVLPPLVGQRAFAESVRLVAGPEVQRDLLLGRLGDRLEPAQREHVTRVQVAVVVVRVVQAGEPTAAVTLIPVAREREVHPRTSRQLPVQVHGHQVGLTPVDRIRPTVVPRHVVQGRDVHEVRGAGSARRALLRESGRLARRAQTRVLRAGRARVDSIDHEPLGSVLGAERLLSRRRTGEEERQRARDRTAECQLRTVEVRPLGARRELVREHLERARELRASGTGHVADDARLCFAELGREGAHVHVDLLQRVRGQVDVVRRCLSERANEHAVDEHGFLVGPTTPDRRSLVGLDYARLQHDDA